MNDGASMPYGFLPFFFFIFPFFFAALGFGSAGSSGFELACAPGSFDLSR